MWYFFRIFVIFYAIWLPGLFLTIFGGTNVYNFADLATIGFIFCGIQPIVSIGLAMVKSDVRKYTTDLLTLTYIRKSSTPTLTNATMTTTTTAVIDELEIAY